MSCRWAERMHARPDWKIQFACLLVAPLHRASTEQIEDLFPQLLEKDLGTAGANTQMQSITTCMQR